MSSKSKTVGGSGTGLGQDFSSFLKQGLDTGSFGSGSSVGQAGKANPYGSTQGIAGVLNDILSGGAGHLGGSLGDLIKLQQQTDVNSIRSRFGVGGGTAFGTPGQYAESTYRAQAAPQIATQVGQLQMSALLPLLQLIQGQGGRDIAQAETIQQENPWLTAAKLGLGGASAFLGFQSPSGVIAPGSSGGGTRADFSQPFNPVMPQFNIPSSYFGSGGTMPSASSTWQPNYAGGQYVPNFNWMMH